MTPDNNIRRTRIKLWAALCMCILEDRPVTLLPRLGNTYTPKQMSLI